MSATVETQVVRMEYDNKEFKKRAAETKQGLQEIDASIESSGKGRGLLNLAGHMETVRVKASAMQVATVTAIANIANRAVNAGVNMVKSLALDPIKDGFNEYELKMKSIQTILANTKGENLQSVTVALKELNKYSDKTIYNFGNMTDAIGRLTTAGIDLKTATGTVKGFSNMVALAGGDATAAAGAMEQFGQGLQAGVIKAMDWQSISTRGLGSQSLQKAFFETARAAGTLADVPMTTTFEEWSKTSGGFKASLEDGWLTTDVATKTLEIMTGDMKNVQQVMAMGFDRKTAEDMLKIADNALESATKVRTLTAFMGTLKEQLGSGWSGIMETLFGNFNKSTRLFTKLSDASGEAIDGFFKYLGGLLKTWDKMGGRTAILKTIGNLLAPIGAILKVITTAWRAAFPKKTAGSGLAAASKGLEALTRPLRWVADKIEGTTPVVLGFGQALGVMGKIVRRIGSNIADFVKNVFSSINIKMPKTDGILEYIRDLGGRIKDAMSGVSDLLDKGESLKTAFSSLDFETPRFGGLPDFKGLTKDAKDSSAQIQGLMFNPDAKADTSRIRDASDGLEKVDRLEYAGNRAKEIGSQIGAVLNKVMGKIGDFFEDFTVEDLIASINVAAITGLMLSIRKFLLSLSEMADGFKGLADGLGSWARVGNSVSGALNAVGQAAGALQKEANAKLIMSIAFAILILVGALWALNYLPRDRTIESLGILLGIAGIMKLTFDALSSALDKLDSKWGGAKLIALSFSLILVAGAFLLLALGLRMIAKLDMGALGKAAVVMGLLLTAITTLEDIKNEQIMKSAGAMVIVAGAVLLLALAILLFNKIDITTFMDGLMKVAMGLTILVSAMYALRGTPASAAALIILVGALMFLYLALRLYATIDFVEFMDGLMKIAMGLTVLVAAAYALAAGNVATMGAAAVLVIMAYSMVIMYDAVSKFADMDWKKFGKGLLMVTIIFVVLGALLGLLGAIAPFAIAGAVALLVFAAAVFYLALALVAIATAMALFGASAAVVGPLLMALAIAGAMAIVAFFQTLAAEAPIMKKSLLAILQVIIDGIVEAVPMVIDGIKRLWAAVKAEFSGGEGDSKKAVMGVAGKSWMDELKDGIKERMPMVIDWAKRTAINFLKGLAKHGERIGGEAVKFITRFTNGVRNNIGPVIESGISLLLAFLDGLGKNAFRLAEGAADVIIEFNHGLAKAIREKGPEIRASAKDVGRAVIEGIIAGFEEMRDDAFSAIGTLAQGVIDKARQIFKTRSPSRVFHDIGKFVAMGLTQGIQKHAAAAIVSVASMVSGQIAVANEYINRFIQDLEQSTLAATAKAVGLQKAADRAQKAAKKTKTKDDDKAARRLQRQAKNQSERADKLNRKVEAEKRKEDRKAEFDKADTITKARMKSEDAQNALDRARSLEFKAAAKREEAEALDRASRMKGLSEKERKAMRKRAVQLRKQAREDAMNANGAISRARTLAESALEWQTKAGKESADSYQSQYDREAKEAADEEAFEKMTTEQKAELRRKQAAELEALSKKNLEEAKKLAYSDIEAANKLAEEAMEQAERAREYRNEANGYNPSGSQGTGRSTSATGGTVVSTRLSDAAVASYNRYVELYEAATSRVSAGTNIEFKQYNTSPDAVDPTELYRQSRNAVSVALNAAA